MKDERIKEITEQLEQGVQALFQSEDYNRYLEFMGRFYNYSAHNCLLIWLQRPDASLVAGFKAWKDKFNRQVRKGEKGIKILAPCPHKFKKLVKDEEGNEVEKEIRYTTFRVTTVFDVSQTDGEALPEIPVRKLEGSVEGYAEKLEALKKISPVPVGFEEIEGTACGYFDHILNRIAVQEGMSEAQTLKTLIHEVCHAMLHGEEGAEKEADRQTKEVQAESVAFTVCSALGLDTGDYSFGYVAGWSKGREAKELQDSMVVIRNTATMILEGLKAA